MTEQLRQGIVARQPEPTLAGEVECDEVYVVAGHKGHPEALKTRPPPAAAPADGVRGRGTLETEKPPILGMIQRGGAVVVRMLDNVQQATFRPLIERFKVLRICCVMSSNIKTKGPNGTLIKVLPVEVVWLL